MVDKEGKEKLEMATGGMKEEQLSPEEEQALMAAFEKLGAKPRTKSPMALKKWMTRLFKTSELDADEPSIPTTPNATTAPTSAAVSTTQTVSTPGSAIFTPKVPTFFGEPGKGEATYDLWRYAVDTLRTSKFQPHVIELAIRNSLRGDAARVAMRLGPSATIDQLLNKLETSYGLSIQHDQLMEQFYSSKQRSGEDITSWANRLEDLLYKACQKKLVRPEEMNHKLCSMF